MNTENELTQNTQETEADYEVNVGDIMHVFRNVKDAEGAPAKKLEDGWEVVETDSINPATGMPEVLLRNTADPDALRFVPERRLKEVQEIAEARHAAANLMAEDLRTIDASTEAMIQHETEISPERTREDFEEVGEVPVKQTVELSSEQAAAREYDIAQRVNGIKADSVNAIMSAVERNERKAGVIDTYQNHLDGLRYTVQDLSELAAKMNSPDFGGDRLRRDIMNIRDGLQSGAGRAIDLFQSAEVVDLLAGVSSMETALHNQELESTSEGKKLKDDPTNDDERNPLQSGLDLLATTRTEVQTELRDFKRVLTNFESVVRTGSNTIHGVSDGLDHIIQQSRVRHIGADEVMVLSQSLSQLFNSERQGPSYDVMREASGQFEPTKQKLLAIAQKIRSS